MMGPFRDTTVAHLARELRDGRTTASELVERSLAAIAAEGDALGAFATVAAEQARAAAREADAELAAGHDRGPLHGIPVGVKDLVDVAGLPTRLGARHAAGAGPAARDATCVARLRAGGAIVVGKTATHEFAYGPTGDRSADGPSRNPHDPSRISGGSSGGSAAAVAAGLLPLALGTDTGGSTRIPAALCGVAGFKPAYGTIPTAGVFPLAPTLDHVGVLARTAEDCRIAYGVLAGAAPGGGAGGVGRRRDRAGAVGEAGTAGDADGGTATAVAWVRPAALHPLDPEVERIARAALERTVAVPVGEVDLPDLAGLHEAFVAIQSGEAYAVHAERVATAPELYGEEVLERLRGAGEVPAWRYVRALAAREPVAGAVADLLERHEVLALPTTPITAPRIDERRLTLSDGTPIVVPRALLSYTSAWNVLGLPALSIPAGTLDGLPVGLQLVTAAGREATLFSLARAIETTVSAAASRAARAR